MADCRITEPGQGGELVMAGSLTVENAGVIRKRLIEALLREEEVVVRIEPGASVDVSFLQLLCSAHRTASKLGKSFVLGQEITGTFRDVVEGAGYFRTRGCSRDRQEKCLWTGGSQ